jgi:uncharacterized protein (DUF305 family)
MKTLLTAALLFAAAPSVAVSQDMGLPPECITEHGGHDMGGTPMDMSMLPPGDAHKALAAGMDAMHTDMMAGMTAVDIDVAFVCGMIPHHQGAIDMAKAVIQYGDDPWTKELAQNIVAAQEAEIAAMKDWLKANAGGPAGH